MFKDYYRYLCTLRQSYISLTISFPLPLFYIPFHFSGARSAQCWVHKCTHLGYHLPFLSGMLIIMVEEREVLQLKLEMMNDGLEILPNLCGLYHNDLQTPRVSSRIEVTAGFRCSPSPLSPTGMFSVPDIPSTIYKAMATEALTKGQ